MSIYSFRKLTRITVIVTVLAIITGLGLAMLKIEDYAKDAVNRRIEAAAWRMASKVKQNLDKSQENLELLASLITDTDDFYASNLHMQMEYFCIMNNFTCAILRLADGRSFVAVDYPHYAVDQEYFESEAAKVPYTASLLHLSNQRDKQYIRQAVPVMKKNKVFGILYGYTSLNTFATYTESKDFNGHCNYYVIDGDTGSFLVDEYHRYNAQHEEVPLDNLFYGKLNDRQNIAGQNVTILKQKFRNGEPSHITVVSQRTGRNYHVYNTPIGINNLFVTISVDEQLAFSEFESIRNYTIVLINIIILCAGLIAYFLHRQGRMELALEQSLAQEAENLSTMDYLTGVGNRRALYEYVLNLQQGSSLGVVFGDVTGLKQVNDEEGHQAGDVLLQKAVSGMLAAFSPEQIFRSGGDEFIIICSAITEEAFQKQINKMQAVWGDLGVNVACGASWDAAYSGDSNNVTALAEERMYAAKKEWYTKNGRERRKN